MKCMRMIALAASLVFFVIGTATSAFAKNKYEAEVEKEQVAVKLVREVQRGGYQIITAEELDGLSRY